MRLNISLNLLKKCASIYCNLCNNAVKLTYFMRLKFFDGWVKPSTLTCLVLLALKTLACWEEGYLSIRTGKLLYT